MAVKERLNILDGIIESLNLLLLRSIIPWKIGL
jgi:hypothetical protein